MAVTETHFPNARERPLATPGLRVLLRDATRAEHHALDAALADALASRTDYVAFLAASRELATATAPALMRIGIADALVRIAAIDADLAALGAPRANVAAPSPHARGTVAQDWGTAYVVEGSALGGRVLADALDARLVLGGAALRFLRLRGSDAGRAWRTFVARLDAFGASADAEEAAAAADAARATFVRYADAFAARGLVARA